MPRKRSKNETVLRPVRPNAGIEACYRNRLVALIDEMNASILYWVRAAYRAHEPILARDEVNPASALRAAIRDLVKRWQGRFDEGANALAQYFAETASKRSDAALKSILRRAGFTVKFRMTKAARDVIQATIAQNVSLIKSIPAQYLTNVEGIVMRSVQTGRDLGQLTDDLREQFGVTKRRAAFIARSQNNLATAAMTRARQVELGITEAIWMHSGGGKEPRPTHLNAGRERARFDVAKGWYDPAVKEHIWPGQLPNCRCVSRSVIAGFS